MHRFVLALVASVGCVASLWVVPVFAQGFPPLAVPAKELPVPPTVSPELAPTIALPVPGDLPTPEPSDVEGWKKLQRETDAAAEKLVRDLMAALKVDVVPREVAGVACFDVVPPKIDEQKEGRLIVHVHGGAFVFNGGLSAVGEAVLLAHATKTRVLSIDYRMPPDHPFPAAPDDVYAVWKQVAAERDPKTTALAGTSAGGNLIMTTVQRAVREKGPLPVAIFLGTPAANLSKTGDSVYANAEIDHALGRYEGRVEACVRLYANGRDLKDPSLSPLFGDLSGFPPTILITGTRDMLLSPTVLTHRKLRKAGVEADLHVYEAQSHADYLTSFPSPESLDALDEIAKFFDRHLKP